jgi:hypothetical protein
MGKIYTMWLWISTRAFLQVPVISNSSDQVLWVLFFLEIAVILKGTHTCLANQAGGKVIRYVRYASQCNLYLGDDIYKAGLPLPTDALGRFCTVTVV